MRALNDHVLLGAMCEVLLGWHLWIVVKYETEFLFVCYECY